MMRKCVLILFLSAFLFALSFSQTTIYTDQDCLICHGKPESAQITVRGKVRSLYVDPAQWAEDIHHKGRLTCVDCHADANPYLHFREGYADVDCARCHPEESEEYLKNIHLTFAAPSANKELPLCYHCHTKHYVLHHDDDQSSVHEKNIGQTCGACHPEVMVEGILKGGSLGKISGHRKGDLSEKFEMKVCINCHYDDSAHGAKRVYKDFCSRCHNVRTKPGILIGPTHLDSKRAAWLNYTGSGLVVIVIIGACVFFGYKSRKGIRNRLKRWKQSMKIMKEKDVS